MPVAKGTRIGGRAKGTPNKVNLATRDRINKEGDPLGVLLAVCNGKAVTVGDVEITPTLDQVLRASETLAKKVIPDLKTSDGGVVLPRKLPAITTAEGCGAAMAAIVELAASGSVTLEQATAFAGLIEARRKSIETIEIEKRLAALESGISGKA